jgi:pyruvate dehydrogenase E1 component alpha subunit
MPYRVVKSFDVKYLQIVDEEGSIDEALFEDFSEELIGSFFEKLILSRIFNQRCLSLQREGRIGTYPSIYGQEASQVGSALALRAEDWVFPSFRESGLLVALGYPMELLLRYWMGDERGMKVPPDMNVVPMSIPVGSHIPHATGCGWAMRLKGARACAVCYFGDGGSSRGDFHEGLNMAGVFKANTVFICQNNQWAISVPRTRQTAAATIAQRAISYGFEGIQVDGNDIFAVYKATTDAARRARDGGGPTLIECFTYRLDDHTTADDASRYRDPEEVERWKSKEPLIRLRMVMKRLGLWSESYEQKVIEQSTTLVDDAIKRAEGMEPPDPADILLYTNHSLSSRQKRELEEG